MKDIFITNFSNKGILIKDLNIRIDPNQTINLIKYKNRGEDMIQKSIESGDIFKMKLIITNNNISFSEPQCKITDKCYPMKSVSAISIEYKKFSELEEALTIGDFENMSDDEKEEMERELIAEQENKLISFMEE